MSAHMQLLFAASIIAVTASGVAAAPALGRGFVVADSGESCESTCSGASQTPGFLNSFYEPDASTYMCAANIDDQAWVPGYQTTEPHCSVTYNGDTVNATTYACLCLLPEQTPGLQPSTGGQSCQQTCQQELQGQVGTAVRTDADTPLFACLPTSEAGMRNRFGVAADQSVSYTPGPVSSEMQKAAGVTPLDENMIPCNSAGLPSTTDYSCFCTFEVPAPSESPSTPSESLTPPSESASVSTAGRKLLLR